MPNSTETKTRPAETSARSAARARHLTQSIVVRDLTVAARIGVGEAERAQPQRLRINIEMMVETPRPLDDDLAKVVDYTDLVPRLRQLCAERRPALLETLADEIAEIALDDPRVSSLRVRVEKLDLHPDTAGVGVEARYERVEK